MSPYPVFHFCKWILTLVFWNIILNVDMCKIQMLNLRIVQNVVDILVKWLNFVGMIRYELVAKKRVTKTRASGSGFPSFFAIFDDNSKWISSNMAKIWRQKMKKSLVRFALNPIFSLFRVPDFFSKCVHAP